MQRRVSLRELIAHTLVALAACRKPTQSTQAATQTASLPQPAELDPPRDSQDEKPGIILSDRGRQAYVILLEKQSEIRTRKDLVTFAQFSFRNYPLARRRPGAAMNPRRFHSWQDMVAFVSRDPDSVAAHDSEDPYADLLGVAIEPLDFHTPEHANLLNGAVLQDPMLARDVPESVRKGLSTRRYGLLIRGEYRPQGNGMLLLRHLVTALARSGRGIIHDVDTLESFGPDIPGRAVCGFRLDGQISIAPFPSQTTGLVRLATRGLRRFGVPDLELDGLPARPDVLQRGDQLLHAVAYSLVRTLYESEELGVGMEVPAQMILAPGQLLRLSYGAYGLDLADCTIVGRDLALVDNPEELRVELRVREPLPTDVLDHQVVQLLPPGDPQAARIFTGWLRGEPTNP